MPKRLPRSRTLKGDPKLAYYDSGGGIAGEPPIVLLHGATFRSEDWENIFPRLATRYRVIAYDARGHGKSGRAESYAIGALADDPAFVEQFGHSKPDGHELVTAAIPTVPTLLLAASAADGSALKEGEADALAKRWPDVQLVRFPGVGHRIHGLRPEPFLEALEPFLRRVRAPVPA